MTIAGRAPLAMIVIAMSDALGYSRCLLSTSTDEYLLDIKEKIMSTNLLTLLLNRSYKIRQWIRSEERRSHPDRLRLLKLKSLQLTISNRLRNLMDNLRPEFAPRLAAPVRVRASGRR